MNQVVPRAQQDNDVSWDEVLHDSRDGYYRSPGWGTTSGSQRTGAVPVGTDVTLRLRTAHNDLTSAAVRIWDGLNAKEFYVPMTIVNSTSEYDYWEATITSPSTPDDYYYNFALTDGTDTDYYNDDANLDGGTGEMSSSLNTNSWGIVFYDPNFTTPFWHRHTIGYQIFLDRFYNGDPTNDAIGDGNSGDILWYEWDSNGDGVFTADDAQRVYAVKKNWGENPSGGSDFFGGDLAGVIAKTDYLQSLGIGEIWFNPFSESPDNHGYSVDNYWSIDPYYGAILERDNGRVINDYNRSLEIFGQMVDALKAIGVNVIYDTVINHVSAQSIFFQRFQSSNVFQGATGFNVPDLYPDVYGAYENPYASPYIDWFKFYEWNNDYDGWWGFKNIPTLKYDQTDAIAETLITGPNNLFKFWIDHGVKGFRLDVNNDYDDGYGSRLVNQLIRQSVKQNDPNAIIMGEIWDRANPWLAGNMNDGVQNMPFRLKTINWIRNEYNPDADYLNFLLSQQENYPPQAYYSQWTILGNHDTARVLTELHENVDFLKIATTLQFTIPGVPMIYYGDEVGMKGSSDPDNRGTFPWGQENQDIFQHYQTLIHLRNNYPVFQDGSFLVLLDDKDGIISFARELPGEEFPAAITVVNKRNQTMLATIDLSSMETINPNDYFVNAFDPSVSFTVPESKVIQIVIDPMSHYVFMKNNSATITLPTAPLETTDNGGFLSFYYAPLTFIAILSLSLINKRK